MPNEIRADETQRRALASVETGILSSRPGGLSAEILQLTPRPRAKTLLEDIPVPNVARQPYPQAQPPLSAQVIFYTPDPVTRWSEPWLFEALVEIEQLSGLAQKSGFVAPSAASLERAKAVARMCSQSGLSEPAFDVREHGEVEIFCRESARGLLIVIHPEGSLQVFGDFRGDQWRARYSMSGSTWRTHLGRFIQDTLAP